MFWFVFCFRPVSVAVFFSGEQEKKLSSGSLGGCDGVRPKVVTVKHPESNKPKPTVKKNKPIQADLDVAKEFARCKEEGTTTTTTSHKIN